MRKYMLIAMLVVAANSTDPVSAQSGDPGQVLVGKAAFGDWRSDAPGVRRHIRPEDLSPPYATPSASETARVIRRPDGALPKVPPGFAISLVASGLDQPRIVRVAPNGDIFIAESAAGRIRALRLGEGGATSQVEIFASGLRAPFGIAFYPLGANPEWVYVADTDQVVRFPYRGGDLKARGAPQTIVPKLPSGGHWTRDLVFSADGTRMYVSVGSGSNDAQGLGKLDPAALRRLEAEHGVGASWGDEADRADVLVFDPQGGGKRVFATGIRNCVGMAVEPATGNLWCSTNERDGFGDDLPPDYITRVREGGFYGWPWYYIGDNEDPRHRGERPDLRGKITVPDVLLAAHSASLGMAFYHGKQFPADYAGNAFAAEHGSWNRSKRTGYKIVRVIIRDGVPTGEYEDFVTGFVVNETSVWARPVGVDVAQDGSLIFSEDGNGTIWRVTYQGGAK